MDRACSECRYNMLPWDYVGEVCKMCRDANRQRRANRCKVCQLGPRSVGDRCWSCVFSEARKEAAKPKKKKKWWSW